MAARLMGTGDFWGEATWGTGTYGSGGLVLPDCLVMRDNNQDFKVDTWTLSFADGSKSAGDEVKDRKVVLEGNFGQVDRAAFRAAVDSLRHSCSLPNQKLQLVAGGPYLNLARLMSIDEDPQALFDWSVGKLRVQWQADDPFWYAPTPEVRTFSPSGDGTLSVDAGPSAGLKSCTRGQHPVITITSPGFASVTTFQLANVTDGGLQLRLQDPYLKNGAVATIDCVNGTVTRDGSNSIQYFEGEFLRLLTEVNTLQYTGPACTIALEWQHRWL